MDNFDLNELMDLAEAYIGQTIDAIYRRLMDRDFALEDSEVVMLLVALINILGHDNRGDRPKEVLLMAAYGEGGDFALEDSEVVMLLVALINILGHDNRGDRPKEVLLMAA